MSGCGNCSGCANAASCGGCSGCASSLSMTEAEIGFLRLLGQVAFLPVARRADDEKPVYLEDGEDAQEEMSLVIQCLEKKELISIDYKLPLKGADMGRYARYGVHGSIALTKRGQNVLELLEYQGYQEE